MTVPTQPVTVNLADFGGSALAGVVVAAQMSAVDETADGTVVSTKRITATTNSSGIAVLQCFPNALAPSGLGTKGTTTLFSAAIPGSKPMHIRAVIPNAPCNLVDAQVTDDVAPPSGYVTETGQQAMTNKTLVNPQLKSQTLADGSTIAWDTNSGQLAFLTLSTLQATRLLSNPSHIKAGAEYKLVVTQNAAGGQGITAFGSQFVAVTDLSINSTPNSITVLAFLSDGTRLYGTKLSGGSGTTSNNPPVNTVPGPQNVAHDTARVFSGANGNTITVADPDGNNLSTTLTVTSGTLTAVTGVGASVVNNGTANVTIFGTPTNINAALFGLSFLPALGSSGTVTLTVSTTDGVATDVDTITLTVASAAGNRPPVNTVPSGTQTVAHDTPFMFSTGTGNPITVDDQDGGTLSSVVSVPVGTGTLTAPTGGGATITSNGTRSVTIAGSIVQVNAGLNGLVFTPTTGSSGSVTLTIATSDGTDTDTDTVPMSVAAATASQADTVQTPLVRHPVDWLQVGNYVFMDGRWGMNSTDTSQEPNLTEGPASYQFQQFMERSLVVNSDGSVAGRWQIRWPQFNSLGHAIDGNSFYSEVKTFPSVLFGKKPGFYGSNIWPTFSVAVRNPDGKTEPTPNPSFTPSNIAIDWQPLGGSVIQTSPSGATPGSSLMPLQLPLLNKTCRMRGQYRLNSTPTGKGHLSFDIWLTQTNTQIQGHPQSSLTHEIMIPLKDWGLYGEYPLRNPNWYDHDVTIDGVLYHVYVTKRNPQNPVTGLIDGNGGLGYYPGLQYNFGGLDTVNGYINEETGQPRKGWKLIIFEHAGDTHQLDANGYFNIDFTKFTEHLHNTLDERGIPFIQNTEYLSSIELGMEVIWGSADVTVYNYLNQVASTVVAAPALPTFTNHAPVNTVPGTQSANSGTDLLFSVGTANSITVLDIDNDALTTTLTVTGGTLLAVTGSGATITNNGTATVTIHGSGYQVNGALEGLKFTPPGTTGAVTFTVATSDGALSDSDNITINVTAASNAPTLIQTQFTAGNNGTWLHNSALTEFYTDGTGSTNPSSWTDLIGRWKNHGTANGHDLIQTDNSLRLQLGTDAATKRFVGCSNATPMHLVGGSTTAFYAAMAVDVLSPSYDCKLLSSRSTANTGVTLEQEAFAATFIAKFGTGSALVTVTSDAYAAGSNNPAGKVVVECWYDGTNCAVRLNKGTTHSAALGTLSAGNTEMLLGGDYPLSSGVGTNNALANFYEVVIFKNYCPGSSDRDTIASWVGAQAGLTV
jgi:hypothetical protein